MSHINTRRKRIGILTAGGDCPGLNAVVRAVASTAINDYGCDVYGIEDGFEGLLESRVKQMNLDDVHDIVAEGGTVLGASNRSDPFKWRDDQGGFSDRSDDVVRRIEALRLDAVLCAGGDGTMAIAHGLAKKGAPMVGIPKTIDNDLAATDVTFGFNSALTVATESLDRLITTAQAHRRAMICEVMGRNAGWIALTAGLAAGAQLILLPEMPFAAREICDVVMARHTMGRASTIIVVAEGAHPQGGDPIAYKQVNDPNAPVRLGGVGHKVAQIIEEGTDVEARVTILGHLQRGGSPTAFDRILGTRYGVAAARLAVSGKVGHMVALQGTEIIEVPLEDCADKQRLVDPGGELVAVARSVGTSFGC